VSRAKSTAPKAKATVSRAKSTAPKIKS
jgi:hypothetical protein